MCAHLCDYLHIVLFIYSAFIVHLIVLPVRCTCPSKLWRLLGRFAGVLHGSPACGKAGSTVNEANATANEAKGTVNEAKPTVNEE